MSLCKDCVKGWLGPTILPFLSILTNGSLGVTHEGTPKGTVYPMLARIDCCLTIAKKAHGVKSAASSRILPRQLASTPRTK